VVSWASFYDARPSVYDTRVRLCTISMQRQIK
jgi:hypothetical protein